MIIINKFKDVIERQRLTPRIYDFSYFLLKNNLQIFRKFKKCVEEEDKKKILDVGCGFKPWQELFDTNIVSYTGVDFEKEKSSADFVAPADALPFEDSTFDALIYSEVLEHVDNIDRVLSEMRRVAKPGALVFISTPFVFPEHGIPHDFQRLTRYFYYRAFAQDDIIILKESNSSFSSALTMVNLAIESTPFRILAGIKHIIYTFNNLLGILADFFIKLIFSRIGRGYKNHFYHLPLGFALIVRIKK